MIRLGVTLRMAAWGLLCVCLSGCFPTGDARLDEQKDPNYLAGRSRKLAMDYGGAAEAFERALEANPRSASAHLEFGLLCYENLNDWAGAIYHLEKFLKLSPQSNKADSIRQFIGVCKQELAKGLPLTSLNQQVQKELAKMEKLMRENAELRQQMELMKLQLAQHATGSNSPGNVPPAVALGSTPALQGLTAAEAATPLPNRDPARATRTHVVRQGETPYAIARTHGVPLNSLLGANPGVDARRLRPGQTLAIPSR